MVTKPFKDVYVDIRKSTPECESYNQLKALAGAAHA